MNDAIATMLLKLVMNNLHYLGWLAFGLAAFGLACGAIRKLVAVSFAAALSAGDSAAMKVSEKPRAVMLGLGAFGLVITGLWAWHSFTAPKIVEKEVVKTVTVRDFSQPDINKIEAERAEAERKALLAKAAADKAERETIAMAAKLAAMQPPESDDAVLERLNNQIDLLHAEGVASEAATFGESDWKRVYVGRDNTFLGQSVYKTVANRHANYRNYHSYRHEDGALTFYHNRCAVCDQSLKARLKIDEIVKRQKRMESVESKGGRP